MCILNGEDDNLQDECDQEGEEEGLKLEMTKDEVRKMTPLF